VQFLAILSIPAGKYGESDGVVGFPKIDLMVDFCINNNYNLNMAPCVAADSWSSKRRVR